MRVEKITGLLSLALFADSALANEACRSESVVFVTVPAPTVTKTVTIPLEKVVGITGKETIPAASQIPTLTDITATLTSYVTLFEIFSVVPVVPTPAVAVQAPKLTGSNQGSAPPIANEGLYYFTEHNGTPVWLDGKTPPADSSFLTSTAFITLEPIPISFYNSAEVSTMDAAEGSTVSTSYSTVSLNSTSTAYQTKVVTSTIPASTASANFFVGLGITGWNTSFTSNINGEEGESAGDTTKQILGQTGAIEKGDIRPETSTADPAPAASANATKQLEARQVGAWVVATIDGALVSWINTYDGSEPATTTPPLISWINTYTGPLPAATPIPLTVPEAPIKEKFPAPAEEPEPVPVYSWDLTPPVSQTTSLPPISISPFGPPFDNVLAPVAEPADVAIYPWDLTPPVTRSTSPAPSRISPSASSYERVVTPVAEPANVAIYPWDLTPPVTQTTNPVSDDIVSSASPSEGIVVHVAEPTNLAIYPWDLTPPQPQISSSASSDISLSTSSSVHRSVRTVDRFESQSEVKSTFSTVTTKVITSVLSFKSVQPTASKVVSTPGSLNTSSSFLAPPSCEDQINSPAEFVITFDDLPTFSTGPDNTDIPPLFNPYRKLYFEEHFGYVPPPRVPFLPHSPPQLAVYRAGTGLNVNGSPGAGLELIGEFGSGPRAPFSAFWIDAFSFWIGCENEGPSNCEVTINGYEFGSSTQIANQDATIPPCPGLVNCNLTFVELGDGFRNLTGLQILAAVNRQLTVFYLDDVSLAWSENNCAAQTRRTSVR